MLIAGIAGFIPPLVSEVHPEFPALAIDAGYGLLFGLFPVNILHNFVHLGFGSWGLLSLRTRAGPRFYARCVAILYAVLTIAGFVPGLDIVFGLAPLFGNDIWLHALIALIGGYFGWVHKELVQNAP